MRIILQAAFALAILTLNSTGCATKDSAPPAMQSRDSVKTITPKSDSLNMVGNSAD
ncbi:MAG TPA: hypothetical protein VGB55_16265 [Tepidisphaeraceae bacterium]|jgi:hypothetical protein